jgi:3-oxoadipate enol-lactonase
VSIALHYEMEGPGNAPVLVLGNSLGTALEMWDRVMPALRPHARVLRYDHRGQGASPVPPGPYDIADLGGDVLYLLDELEIERANYCGVSIAGMVGLWLAAKAPERIERLVAFCTSAHPRDLQDWEERGRIVGEAGSTAPIADAVLGRWLTPDFVREHPHIVEELRTLLLASPPEGYATCCRAIAGVDLREDLARISAPTLVVSAAQDASIPPEQGERVAAGVPGARFELLERAAHIPMAERPDTVGGLIVEHLEVKV